MGVNEIDVSETVFLPYLKDNIILKGKCDMSTIDLQQKEERTGGTELLEDILENIVGTVSDMGKSLEKYKEERIREIETKTSLC